MSKENFISRAFIYCALARSIFFKSLDEEFWTPTNYLKNKDEQIEKELVCIYNDIPQSDGSVFAEIYDDKTYAKTLVWISCNSRFFAYVLHVEMNEYDQFVAKCIIPDGRVAYFARHYCHNPERVSYA